MTDRYANIRKALADMDAAAEARNAIAWRDAHARFVVHVPPDTIRELLAERDQLAAALEAAREDARKWRYWANGPQGTFLTDDLQLATAILAAYDKDDDWTVTDIVDPTGPPSTRRAGRVAGRWSRDRLSVQVWRAGADRDGPP